MSSPISETQLERWQQLLDGGRAVEVLDEALKVLQAHPESLDVALVCSWAWSTMGDRWGAYQQLRSVRKHHEDSPELMQELAETAFLACQFPEAREAARYALQLEPGSPLPLYVLGLLAEREGDLDQADRLQQQAHELEPGEFPGPRHLGDEEFATVVQDAIAGLSPEFQEALANVRIVEEPVPPDHLLQMLGPEAHPFLLGLYLGDQDNESVLDPRLDLPPTIFLFRRNIERAGEDPEEMREQVRLTIYHEVGHHLGFGEEGLAGMGLE